MNQKPYKPCSKYGCANLTRTGYCEEHKSEKVEKTRRYDRYSRDAKATAFYNSGAWRKLRNRIKSRDNGLCQSCLADKRLVVGNEVDHIIPIKQDWSLRLTESNLQLLCGACHRKKTAEDVQRWG